MIFVGLFGFYVISNAVRRDIVSRCGMIMASTPMGSGRIPVRQVSRQLAFLFTFLGGFMLSSMVMLLVRGEARLEPLVFIQQYLLLTPPAIMFVSAVAVLFESIRFPFRETRRRALFFPLDGALGLAFRPAGDRQPDSWGRYFDVSGFGFMIDQMHDNVADRIRSPSARRLRSGESSDRVQRLAHNARMGFAAHRFHPCGRSRFCRSPRCFSIGSIRCETKAASDKGRTAIGSADCSCC